MRIGIDLGNVLTERRADGLPVFADDRYPLQPAPGAFDTVRSLVSALGPDHVFVVSRCSPEAERLGIDWLGRHKFAERTGVPDANLFFCRQRHEKAGIAGTLRLTHFVDDRWTVLQHLVGLPDLVKMYLFRPTPEELTLFERAAVSSVRVAEAWTDVATDLDLLGKRSAAIR